MSCLSRISNISESINSDNTLSDRIQLTLGNIKTASPSSTSCACVAIHQLKKKKEKNAQLTDLKFICDVVGRDSISKDSGLVQLECIRTLGSGITCVTYSVQECVSGEYYALKMMPMSISCNEALFKQEWKILSILNKLKCPGIIKSHGVFVDTSNFFLLLELAQMDLFSLIKQFQKLIEHHVQFVVRLLLTSLNFMHYHQIVHRDIKPENVTLKAKTKKHEGNRVELTISDIKIIDFGNSLCDVEDGSLYQGHVGTLFYMSPESYKNFIYGWECKAADIWAVGVFAYEMLTGKRLFYGNSTKEIKHKICNGIWSYPNESENCISLSAKHFIESILTVAAEDRPTAQACLYHPWLATDNIKSRTDIWRAFAQGKQLPQWATYTP